MRRYCAWSLCAAFIFAGCDDGDGGGADPDAMTVTPDAGPPTPDMAAPPDPDTGIPPPTPDTGPPPPTPDMGPPPPDPDMGLPPIMPIAPTRVEMVASEGFSDPMDAVASPDGMMFYFTAHGPALLEKGEEPDPVAAREQTAGIFSVSSAGGPVRRMADGDQLENPSGLLMSCDGSAVYVADLGQAAGDPEAPGLVYRMSMGGDLAPIETAGVGEAAGLAFNDDCSTLYVTGYDPMGVPALFTLPPAGGRATVVKSGDPLVSPSGVHVDTDDVAWVMDQLPEATEGGVLFAIDLDGTTRTVVEGLRVSAPAGVSLVAGGEIAVIPSRGESGMGQLVTVDTRTGDRTVVEAPMMVEPAGIRAARRAPVLAVVDADGDAIFRAE